MTTSNKATSKGLGKPCCMCAEEANQTIIKWKKQDWNQCVERIDFYCDECYRRATTNDTTNDR